MLNGQIVCFLLFISFFHRVACQPLSEMLLESNLPTNVVAYPKHHAAFQLINDTNILRKSVNQTLLVFIAITSAPDHHHLRHAARSTWLGPCKKSLACDYRFFVDCFNNFTQHPALYQESIQYKDIVFRNACKLLQYYHPNPQINYGNAPPVEANLHSRVVKRENGSHEIVVDLPDYFFRRRYKIDWKVCFMQWIDQQYQSVEYYVFVEDDSFVCTANLLYQLSLLQNLSRTETVTEFRTGTPMFDGFDDSSTIMTRRIAETFVNHYLEEGFNCSNVFNSNNNHNNDVTAMPWLSWGNSWISKLCNWTAIIESRYGYHINRPNVICSLAEARTKSSSIHSNHNPNPNQPLTLELHLPCTSHPLILHHAKASHILLKEHSLAQVSHLCEYMLLIDKIKHPEAMQQLWNLTSTHHHFHDFSNVFRSNDLLGWPSTIQKLEKEEEACSRESESHFPNRNLSSHTSHKPVTYPCLFDGELITDHQKRKRSLRSHGSHIHRRRNRVTYRRYFENLLFD